MLFIAVAADSASQHQILTDTEICLGIRHKAQTGFEDTHAALLTVLVIHDGAKQTGPQGEAHRGHFAGDRAWQNQGFLAWVDQLLQFRIHEAVGDHFLIAFVIQHGFHTLQGQIGFAMGAHHQAGLYRLVRDVVVAVNTSHFFHQVFFDFHIETPAWCNGLPLVLAFGNLTAQTAQDIAHLRIRNVMANQTIQLATTQRDGRTLRQRRLIGHINHWTCFTAADIDQQASGTFHRFVLQCRINTALVAVRGISMQTVATRAAGNGQRAEECTLQQNILRVVVNA